ncbi:TPA: sugar phosphate isomerase/epimerase, partial [bacterium]|nr:sugar phosphate isomerase/epimerase [bacterium]
MLISAMQEVFGTDDDLLAIEHAGYWGFDAIELITKTKSNGRHLPYTDEQKQAIKDAIETNGIMLSSICVGSSREFGLVDYGDLDREEVIKDFSNVILSARDLDTGIVLISFFGKNRIKNEDDQNRVIENISELVPIAEDCRLILALEMTLFPEIMTDMIDRIGSQSVGIYYDVGNMTAGGFDNADAIRELGGYISAIHIKDRVIGNGGRRLGEG